MKPRLRAIAEKVVQINPETPVEKARLRAGGSFGYERKDFEWKSGPTVLTQWLTNRLSKK